jgi:hypothetical protein
MNDVVLAEAPDSVAHGLFDANAHPDALHAPLIDRQENDEYQKYVELAQLAGLSGACAVALPGTEPRQHLERCRRSGFLTPVAPWQSVSPRRVRSRVQALKKIGYSAIKIHPRLGGPPVGSKEFQTIAEVASDEGCVLFVCTYPFGAAEKRLGDSLLGDLESAILRAPTARMVLLHAGTVDILRYIEFCRANEHLLLDLSLTIMKYAGSSVDQDLSYALNSFDRRICVGTDYPWYSPADLVERLSPMIRTLDPAKRNRILRGNIENYLTC